MANREHVELLKQVDKWNEWRQGSQDTPNLSGANLGGANLRGAKLGGANLIQVDLRGANLTEAELSSTSFGDIDLRSVKGLESVRHQGPSHIGIDTIYRSAGEIPEIFLRGAGVPEPF